jgi:hypothetical protein
MAICNQQFLYLCERCSSLGRLSAQTTQCMCVCVDGGLGAALATVTARGAAGTSPCAGPGVLAVVAVELGGSEACSMGRRDVTIQRAEEKHARLTLTVSAKGLKKNRARTKNYIDADLSPPTRPPSTLTHSGLERKRKA